MRTLNDLCLTTVLADVSTSGTHYISSPDKGRIIDIYATLGGTIATDDAAITTSINGTAVTGGAMTLTASGSAAGDAFTATPTAANEVIAGDQIGFATDGASTNTVPLFITVVIRR